MSHASGAVTSLAFDQGAHDASSALNVFLQLIAPRSAAEFETAGGFAPPFPQPPSRGVPRDPASCVAAGGTWDSVRRRCEPPPLVTFPPPTFPGGGGGPMTPEEDRLAAACAARGGFYNRQTQQCEHETGEARPGAGDCQQRCTGGSVIERGACRAACMFGATIAPILIVVVGIILLLVAFALIAK